MMEFALAVTTGEWKETENIDTNFNIFFFFFDQTQISTFFVSLFRDITTKSDKLIGHDKVQRILKRLTTRIKESERA